MKKLTYIILGISFALTSCNDVLDQEPLGLISDASVWQDENLVDTKLNQLYKNSLFLNQAGQSGFNAGLDGNMAGEFRNIGPWQEPFGASTGDIDETGTPAGAVQYWAYTQVRNCNEFIVNMETISELDADFKLARIAEARFLRGYVFFHMVKRYGGVPIITEPQAIDAPAEELFVSRNTEEEVYNFIISEMRAIEAILPDKTTNDGTPSKWAAMALRNRAALYAGSIGEYGTVQLDGVVGIPDAEPFWQEAYNTSKTLIEQSGHSLYQRHSDPAKNFQELFTDENENPEVIFSEKFDDELNAHSFSLLAMPWPFHGGWGANFFVFYDTVELFDFADGSTGKIDRSLVHNQEWHVDDFFRNRDPRFVASVFFPESDWQGGKVYFHDNTINATSAPPGWSNRAPGKNRNQANGTGLLLRKRVDEGTEFPIGNTDDTDYIVFRLGETYLNLAEAAFHLGYTDEALDAINMIRARAGMPARTSLTLENIQQERRVELFAEDQAYWDLRRWRIAVDVLNGTNLQGLKFTYNGATDKYKIQIRRGASTGPRVFQEKHYYLPITINRVADNPNLVENPGY
ncbi:RagB/SusD family nutrient uptake outer membrane protein [Urechidicola sp. KH5]